MRMGNGRSGYYTEWSGYNCLIKVKRSSIHIPYRHMTERLAPMVRERVLHITCAQNLRSILAGGEVSGNADGALASSFGSSSNGFFRRRNAVSVFDYRGLSNEIFEESWFNCGPLTALHRCGFKIAILFLAPASHNRLISWRQWHAERAYDQMLVPHVESGYPAPLPIAAVEEVLEVTTRYYPSKLEKLVRGALMLL